MASPTPTVATLGTRALLCLWLAFGGTLALVGGCGEAPTSPGGGAVSLQKGPQAGRPADTTAYATVLERRVDAEGLVDYAGLQGQPRRLDRFLAVVADVSQQRYQAWPEKERIAFLINAYNAITLRSIIDQKPIKASIRDILGVWRIRTHPVMGRSLTLDAIEHQILRKEFNEPRIHAALVCAALSCPPLRREPYSGEQLDAQLEDQVRRWLGSGVGLHINRREGTVKISAIFQWFADDWGRADPDAEPIPGHGDASPVLRFIARHLEGEDRAYVLAGDYTLSYLDYDWSLNRQQPGSAALIP
jgi:hypothetical protein